MSGDTPDPKVSAAGTVTPHYPPFVETATEVQSSITFNKISVKLYTMSFLGVKFGPGVNSILADRLIKAQRNLYNLCLQQKSVAEVSEEEFGFWCWLGQAPVFADVKNLGQIQPHLGLKDINSSGSRHASGSAVDMNLAFNPFIAGRTGNTVYGETHETFPDELVRALASLSGDEFNTFVINKNLQVPKGQSRPPLPDPLRTKIRNAKLKFWQDKIWGPAIETYDRAMNLFYAEKADVHDVATDPKRFDEISTHVNRFARVHFALQSYLGFVFQDKRTHKVVDFDSFADQFETNVTVGGFHPNAKDLDGQPLNITIATNRDDVCKKFYAAIQNDHDALKLVMVNGSCRINADGTVTAPSSRDPCNGFLNFRPEVVAELAGTQKLRWGCCMFGAGPDGSGDVMHFDLGTHFGNNGVAPDTLNKQPGT
jgi:hypothetical protein